MSILQAVALAVAVLAVEPLAHGTPDATPTTAPIRVFGDITIDREFHTVTIHRASLAATLDGRFNFPPTIDAKARTIALDIYDDCDARFDTVTLTFDQLTARLDNVAAYRLHVAKKYADAAAGFARVVALDPSFRIGAINLASARQLVGDKAGAVAALAPWLAREPIAMYATVVADPELAPLLSEPALRALTATTPGDVVVAPRDFKSIAYADALHLLAVEGAECSWGTADPGQCRIEIDIFDATTGARVTSLPLLDFDGDDERLAVRRAEVAQRTLRLLGFRAEHVVVGKDTTTDVEHLKRKFSLPSLAIGVVGVEGEVNVLHGDTSLAHVTTLRNLHGVTWAPAAHALVVFSGRAGHEGCEGTDPQLTTIVPLHL